jgi:hypothetical protein
MIQEIMLMVSIIPFSQKLYAISFAFHSSSGARTFFSVRLIDRPHCWSIVFHVNDAFTKNDEATDGFAGNCY